MLKKACENGLTVENHILQSSKLLNRINDEIITKPFLNLFLLLKITLEKQHLQAQLTETL